jgi:hypothetical protein
MTQTMTSASSTTKRSSGHARPALSSFRRLIQGVQFSLGSLLVGVGQPVRG